MKRLLNVFIASLLLGGVFGQHPTQARTGSGNSWTSYRLPTPAGLSKTPFAAQTIRCPVASTCDVAGDTFDDFGGGGPALDIIDSGKWRSPSLGKLEDGDSSVTTALSCPTTKFCAGGGSFGPGDNLDNGFATPFLIQKTAYGWQLYDLPQGGDIDDMSCTGSRFCVGVGYDYTYYGSGASNRDTSHSVIETYNGQGWNLEQAPLPLGQTKEDNTGMSHVLCRSYGVCIAIGGGGDDWPVGSAGQSAIYTLSRGRWTVRSAPTPSGTHGAHDVQLNSITCPRSGPCVIVGDYQTGSGGSSKTHPLLLSQEKSGWSVTTVTAPASYAVFPQRVACPAAGRCVAMGTASKSNALYFAGLVESKGKWKVTVTPPPGRTELAWDSSDLDQVYGIADVACVSKNRCLGAGLNNAFQMTPNAQGCWSLEYKSGVWSTQRIPNPPGVHSASPSEILSVVRKGSGFVAVGNYFSASRTPGTPQGMIAFHP